MKKEAENTNAVLTRPYIHSNYIHACLQITETNNSATHTSTDSELVAKMPKSKA